MNSSTTTTPDSPIPLLEKRRHHPFDFSIPGQLPTTCVDNETSMFTTNDDPTHRSRVKKEDDQDNNNNDEQAKEDDDEQAKEDDDDPTNSHRPPILSIYLIDMDHVPNTLQKVISEESMEHTIVYCFCGAKAPKIAMTLLDTYSQWFGKDRLRIVPLNSTYGDRVSDLELSFWVGKLAQTYDPSQARFFIASDNPALQCVVEELQVVGFEVETAWPNEVVCTPEIMHAILYLLASPSSGNRPDNIDDLKRWLRTKVPHYIPVEDVVRKLQDDHWIQVHRKNVIYQLPTQVPDTDKSSSSRKPPRRRIRHGTPQVRR